MVIVELDNEFDELRESLENGPALVIPIYSDIYKHSKMNRVSCLYIHPKGGEEYLVGFSHNDVINTDKTIEEILSPNQGLYVLGKKQFMYHYQCEKMFDVDLIHYWNTNKPLDSDSTDTKAHDFLYRQLSKYSNANDVIPISKHYERCVRIKKNWINTLDGWKSNKAFEYYNDLVIGSLYNIEKHGLFVDYSRFLETFGRNGLENNLTFSEYNIYTTTGRPSNRHSGINYGALNKDDGTRKVFISRHQKDGFLLSFDYDAYHLRLIAELTGYKFPDDVNIHDYLGKQYFGVDKLTPEQYKESKTISFRQLYGGVQSQYNHIPYFKSVTKYIEELWFGFQHDGYIETAVFGRKLKPSFYSDINKNKLFNYLLQNLETERNMMVIHQLDEYLKDKETKMVLYTYDSLLFDYCLQEGKEVILEIKTIMEKGGFPVTLSIGSDYHDIKDVKL